MRNQPTANQRFLAYSLLLGVSTVAWSFALVALPFQALDHPHGRELLARAVLLGLVPRLLAPLLAPWLRSNLRGINAVGAVASAIVLFQASRHAEPGLIQLAYVLLGINVVLDSTSPLLLVRAWFPPMARMRANALAGVVTLGVPVVAWPLAGLVSELLGSPAVLAFAALGFLLKALLSYTAIPASKALSAEDEEASGDVVGFRSYAPLFLIVLIALAWLGYLQVAVPSLLDRLPSAESIYGWYGGLFSLGMAAGAGALFAIGNRWEAVQTAGATYLQSVVPQASLARVFTWMSSATSAASMLGAYLAGRLLEAHVLLAGGVAILLAMATLLFWVFGNVRLLPRGLRLRPWPLKERR